MAAIADQVVVEVLADTDQTRRKVREYADAFERDMKRTGDAATRAENTIVPSMRQKQYAIRNLGLQVGDFAQQLASGADPWRAFGNQAGQAAGALADFGGRLGTVGAFLSGPWGGILIAATTLLGSYAFATEEAEKKTREKGEAARNLKEAVDDLEAATGGLVMTTEEEIRAAQDAAQSHEAKTKKLKEQAQASLQAARANLALAQSARLFAGGGAIAAVGEFFFGRQADDLAAKIAEYDKQLARYEQQGAVAAGRLIEDRVKAQLDPLEAAVQRYDRIRSQLYRDREKIGDKAFEAGIRKNELELEATRDRLAAERRERARRPKKKKKIESDLSKRLGGYENSDLPAPLEIEILPPSEEQIREAVAVLQELGNVPPLEPIDIAAFERATDLAREFTQDLSRGLADALVYGDDLGDVLTASFKRAAAALIESKILQLLDPQGTGAGGSKQGAFGSILNVFSAALTRKSAGRASGGHVSAGQLYRINEGGGRRVEGFVPAGSGKVIPLGAMQAAQPRIVGAGAQTVRVVSDVRVEPSPLFVATVETRTQQVAAEQTGRAFRDAYRPRLGRSPGAS